MPCTIKSPAKVKLLSVMSWLVIAPIVLAFVKYKLPVDSMTLAVVKSVTFAFAFNIPITLA